MSVIEHTHIPADDGRPLAATWYLPEATVRGVVVVAPAMATPSAFYGPFARALADEGFAVLTFDYRGVEPGADIRSVQADLRTWAADAAAVLDSAHAVRARRWADTPLTWVGHSFGGQILGFVDHSVLDRAVVVASGHGYWQHNPPALRRWVRAFWDVVVPVSVGVAGYYPGRRLRFLSDLPAGVMWQWRRWCLHPGYWQADVPDILERHAAVRVPVEVHVAAPFVRNTARLEALGITPRELEILELIAAGLSTREIAGRLFVSENTVKTHAGRLFDKLSARRRTQAVQLAKEAGLIP